MVPKGQLVFSFGIAPLVESPSRLPKAAIARCHPFLRALFARGDVCIETHLKACQPEKKRKKKKCGTGLASAKFATGVQTTSSDFIPDNDAQRLRIRSEGCRFKLCQRKLRLLTLTDPYRSASLSCDKLRRPVFDHLLSKKVERVDGTEFRRKELRWLS